MKKGPLPKVSDDTFNSVVASLEEEFGDDVTFIQEYYKKLKKENPEIINLVAFWTKNMKHTSKSRRFIHTTLGMFLVYKLLESQAEADKLEESLGE